MSLESNAQTASQTPPSEALVGERQRQAGRRSYVFAGFCLSPDQRLLLRDGRPVRIGGRPLDILTILVERAGILVTKAELEAHAWGDTFLHESNLKVTISALRKILAERIGETRTIVNVPGRGYVFVLPVQLVEARDAAAGRIGQRRSAARLDLVGRDDDVQALIQALDHQSLVTVVGAGGVGKTSLALAAAAASRRFSAATCFVDLSVVDDPTLAPHAVAAALGVRIDHGDQSLQILRQLTASPTLLVLDNCEHLLTAVRRVVDGLGADLSGSAVLATSREPLRSRHETIFRLSPLACPAPGLTMDAAKALESPAVRLLVQRAADAGDFRLTDAAASAAAAICRRLDGLPLAIGLVAPRLGDMAIETILERLDERLDLTASVQAGAPSRQQSLIATLEWSYDLLSPNEALVLRHCSAFAGEFSLDDAIAILASTSVGSEDIVAALESLISKSFGSARMVDGVRRYRLFESCREHAAMKLQLAGERPAALRAHARLVLTTIERAESEWVWWPSMAWTRRYAPIAGDLRRALAWAFGPAGEVEWAIRLVASALPLWDQLCLLAESRGWVEDALAALASLPGRPAAKLHVKLAFRHAWSLTYSGALLPPDAKAWNFCLDLARQSDSADYELRALHGLGIYQTFAGRSLEAIAPLMMLERLAKSVGDDLALAGARRILSLARVYVGQIARGERMLEALAHRIHSSEGAAQATRFSIDLPCIINSSLAFTRWLRGRTDEAMEAAKFSLDAAAKMDHPVSHANSLLFAGVPLALWTGQLDLASARLAGLRQNQAILHAPIWRQMTEFYSASVDVVRGDYAAVEAMAASLDDLLARGFATRCVFHLCNLAEALLWTGDPTGATQRLDQAQARLDASGEVWARPEVLRVRALLHESLERPVEARLEAQLAAAAAVELGAWGLHRRIVTTAERP